MSQIIEDKIINHLVSKYFLIDIFDKKLIDENCATRKGKGTHYALRLFKKNYNYYKNKHEKFYILKFDINKYFYNIDHNVIKNIIKKNIKDNDVLSIINTILDSTNKEYVNVTINNLKESEIKKIINSNLNKNDKRNRILELKNIPLYKKDKGCPIGNMSSQIIATFYLNELDHYIKEELKNYVRYMDDGVIMYNDKDYLEECLIKINEKLKEYKLVLNKKTRIYLFYEEIEFLGFRFNIVRNKIIMKVTNKTKNKFKKKIKIMYYKLLNDEISYDEYRSVRDSYKGHLKHGNCNELLNHYIII